MYNLRINNLKLIPQDFKVHHGGQNPKLNPKYTNKTGDIFNFMTKNNNILQKPSQTIRIDPRNIKETRGITEWNNWRPFSFIAFSSQANYNREDVI